MDQAELTHGRCNFIHFDSCHHVKSTSANWYRYNVHYTIYKYVWYDNELMCSLITDEAVKCISTLPKVEFISCKDAHRCSTTALHLLSTGACAGSLKGDFEIYRNAMVG